LEDIAKVANSVFIPRGIELPCLDQKAEWVFQPDKQLRAGAPVTGGDILGIVEENTLFSEHKIMIDPKIQGKIVEIMPEGTYTVSDPIATVQTPSGKTIEVCMSHFWPVRTPRPYVEKLQANEPLLTGQRVLDAMYPSVLGGTCAIPGAFGCGKTCIS
jgi:V-type H+-transporting ATPase subunit A